MGFWPFGRGDAEVETSSRVVTGATKTGLRVRGKLTIHFAEGLSQAAAEAAADDASLLAEALLREADSHESLIGSEPEISGKLLARYPAALPPVRAIELAALHVVGDPALSGALRRASSGSMQAVRPLSSVPPPLATHASTPPPMKRRPSSQMRALRLPPLPFNPTPEQAGAFLAPLAHDAATRLLIGFLRAHDLLGVRRLPLDAATGDMLIPVSEAPPGGFEASRAEELARWQAKLAGTFAPLRREAHLVMVYVAHQTLLRAGVASTIADEVVATIATLNLAEREATSELVRFPDQLPANFSADIASSMHSIVPGVDEPAPLGAALAPLVVQIEEDAMITARALKAAFG